MKEFTVRTDARDDLKDITQQVQQAADALGCSEGACLVFIPHTTAGVTINENADPDVVSDLLHILDKTIPWRDRNYLHGEGNSAAHAKASLMGFSTLVPVAGGRLVLGTWQSVYLCEFDGPRSRRVQVQEL